MMKKGLFLLSGTLIVSRLLAAQDSSSLSYKDDLAPAQVILQGIEHRPAFVDAVVTILNGDLWKFAIYFENINFATAPMSCTCSTTLPTPIVSAQYEMYNVTNDPLETDNLAGNPTYASTQAELYQILLQQMAQKALLPKISAPYIPIVPPPS